MEKRRIISKKPFSVGVDLGGTKIAVGLCKAGEIEKKVVYPTEPGKGTKHVLATIAKACKEVMEGFSISEISGVGIGAAGQIDPHNGVVLYAPNLDWRDVAVTENLSKKLRLPVKITNDVRAATLAEWYFGAGKGIQNFINVFIGTGIGAGIVLNNRVLAGTTNSAGELGHICLVPDGPICGCGKGGCLEALASGRGLENRVKERLRNGESSSITGLCGNDLSAVTGHIIGKAAQQGDLLALDALKSVGFYLGMAFANIHTFLNPEVILLGGGLMALSDFFLPEMEATVGKMILPVADHSSLFRSARFQTDAALLGSSTLFL